MPPPEETRTPARPRIDLHAHPGRCFLHGLGGGDPARGPDIEGALTSLRAGRVTAASFATVADMRVLRPTEAGMSAVRDFAPGEAFEDHQRQLAGLHEIVARPGVRAILAPEDVEATSAAAELGVLLACEGGDFLERDLTRVAEAYEAGVRTIQLVHYRVNELGDIQTEPPVHGGLTPFGGDVIGEMNRLGMIVDLAHAPWSVVEPALARSTAPVMISHSHLIPATSESHPRLLSEEHARAVAAAGGVIGVWPSGFVLQSFDGYLDEIARMVDLLGAEHVGIGTDMDGNYRPVMTRFEQFDDLEAGLAARGLSEDDVTLVLGGSFVRLFERVVEAAAPVD